MGSAFSRALRLDPGKPPGFYFSTTSQRFACWSHMQELQHDAGYIWAVGYYVSLYTISYEQF